MQGCSSCQATDKETCTRTTSLGSTKPPLGDISLESLLFPRKIIVIVDSYSRYLDFKKFSGKATQEVVSIMKEWLATHGVRKVIETDNGLCYALQEFAIFSKDWGIPAYNFRSKIPRSKWPCWTRCKDSKRPTPKMFLRWK